MAVAVAVVWWGQGDGERNFFFKNKKFKKRDGGRVWREGGKGGGASVRNFPTELRSKL